MTITSRLPLRSMLHNEEAMNKAPESASKATTSKSFATPSKKGKKRTGAKIMSSIKKKGGKLRRTLTPPRGIVVGCAKTPVRMKTPLTFSPKFRNAHDYQIKSCEMDPSPFQTEIPCQDSVLKSSKLCAVMDNYVDLCGVDFDFSTLMPFGGASPDINTLLLSGAENELPVNQALGQDKNRALNKINPILSELRETVGDIVVEGFFRAHAGEEIGRVEVVIFSSQSLRQFFCVYRGSSKLQDRPICGNRNKSKPEHNSEDTESEDVMDSDKRDDSDNMGDERSDLSDIIKTDVDETVLKAYNETNLEQSVFTLLNRLTGFKPFCDITVIGHSFGGAIATVAASKYASQRPAAMVRCHVFGSPQVGGFHFRSHVHSLPNLNLIRVERSTDPFVSLPVSETMQKSRGRSVTSNHVGHCLRINPSQMLPAFAPPEELRTVDVQLYRFDKFRPSSSFVTSSVNSVYNFSKLKIGNEIRSYVKDLSKSLNWPDTFKGQLSGKPISNGFLA